MVRKQSFRLKFYVALFCLCFEKKDFVLFEKLHDGSILGSTKFREACVKLTKEDEKEEALALLNKLTGFKGEQDPLREIFKRGTEVHSLMIALIDGPDVFVKEGNDEHLKFVLEVLERISEPKSAERITLMIDVRSQLYSAEKVPRLLRKILSLFESKFDAVRAVSMLYDARDTALGKTIEMLTQDPSRIDFWIFPPIISCGMCNQKGNLHYFYGLVFCCDDCQAQRSSLQRPIVTFPGHDVHIPVVRYSDYDQKITQGTHSFRSSLLKQIIQADPVHVSGIIVMRAPMIQSPLSCNPSYSEPLLLSLVFWKEICAGINAGQNDVTFHFSCPISFFTCVPQCMLYLINFINENRRSSVWAQFWTIGNVPQKGLLLNTCTPYRCSFLQLQMYIQSRQSNEDTMILLFNCFKKAFEERQKNLLKKNPGLGGRHPGRNSIRSENTDILNVECDHVLVEPQDFQFSRTLFPDNINEIVNVVKAFDEMDNPRLDHYSNVIMRKYEAVVRCLKNHYKGDVESFKNECGNSVSTFRCDGYLLCKL